MFAPDLLAGKVAVITGAGAGIGAGIAEAFAAAGAAVAIGYHSNGTRAEQLASRINERGARALAHQCDVRDQEEVRALFATTIEAFGRVDFLVNNSGITEPRPLLDMTAAEWDKTLDINLRGAFFCTQQAARQMIAQGSGGAIVNISSVHSFAGHPEHAHYQASKGGINQLTRACAIELAPQRIRVNAIAPGAIEVDRFFGFAGYDRDEWGTRVPLGRIGMPEDIGPLAVFLCTTGASYITGQIIFVDGGLTSRLGAVRR